MSVDIILYAREEPTTDPTLLGSVPETKQKDTVFYRDRDLTRKFCRWSWMIGGRSVRRKYARLNGYKYKLIWCEPKERKNSHGN